MKKLTQPLKTHGGKNGLAARFIHLMPSRCKNPNKPDSKDQGWLHYVEPYAGGLAVLLANDPEGISEVINDLNGELVNFWMALQCETSFRQMERILQAVPFAQTEFDNATKFLLKSSGCTQTVSHAVKFFIRCRQSLSGRANSFAGITRNRTRRGMNEQVSAWLNAIDGLPAIHARLKRVLILNQPAIDVISREDDKRTLFYIDAPYVHSTRSSTTEYGDYEMTDDQHMQLIDKLLCIKGKAMVSMYHHPIYDVLSCKYGWRLIEFNVDNKASGSKSKRRMIECLWMNYK